MARARSHAVCSKVTGRIPSKWTLLIKAIFAGRFFACEKFAQLARECFVILAVALRSLEIRFHLSSEVAQRSLGLRAMLAVLVPVVRQEAEKNGDGDQRDFEEQAEERSSMFSAAQAHAREYGRVRADISSWL